jgi:hypothetical protein
MSYRKYEKPGLITKSNANAYLGPDSRRHFRVLADFTKGLPVDMKPTATGYTSHRDIRLYGMTDGKVSVLYVHHFADHSTAYTSKERLCIWTGPGKFRLKWVNPEDGQVVQTAEVESFQQYLHFELPAVKVDVACRIDRVGEVA